MEQCRILYNGYNVRKVPTYWCHMLRYSNNEKQQTLGELGMRGTAIDGLGCYWYAFTRGLLLVARRESDTG